MNSPICVWIVLRGMLIIERREERVALSIQGAETGA